MGLLLARKPEHEALCFSRKVAAGDEGYLVCAAVAAAILSLSNRFSLGILGVLQPVVVHVGVVPFVS